MFEKNIGIITKQELILPKPHRTASIFWTMNPSNVYRDNVAVNAPYWGYSFRIPKDIVDFPNTLSNSVPSSRKNPWPWETKPTLFFTSIPLLS